MMRAASFCHLLRLKGWEHSKGLDYEIRWFNERGVAAQTVDLAPHWYDSPMLQAYCMPDDYRLTDNDR